VKPISPGGTRRAGESQVVVDMENANQRGRREEVMCGRSLLVRTARRRTATAGRGMKPEGGSPFCRRRWSLTQTRLLRLSVAPGLQTGRSGPRPCDPGANCDRSGRRCVEVEEGIASPTAVHRRDHSAALIRP